MIIEDPRLPDFLREQIRKHGGRVEVDAGFWLLFVLPFDDELTNSLARTLLAEVKFSHHAGVSDDDRWMLYYVDTASRAEAMHWLVDLQARISGEARPVSPAHRALLLELVASPAPHRIAQRLAELHTRDEIPAGAVFEPVLVRAMLDRLHAMEPLFFAAFQTVLTNHLVDMVALLQQVISEDLTLKNDIVKAGLSRDPFLQSRQNAAAEIRNHLIHFHVINPLDQQKNSAIKNPYAAYLELLRTGDDISAPLDGTALTLTRRTFVAAIHAIRRNLYRGDLFENFDTQAPWMHEEIALPFRFIKQQLAAHPELSKLDGLYMLERAIAV